MQTFLPFADYRQGFECLDDLRLRNQVCRECLTLLRGGWQNHPASKMWQGHFHELARYSIHGMLVLQQRSKCYIEVTNELYQIRNSFPDTGAPKWLGDPALHASHRSNLLRKDPVWYGQFNWSEPDNLPYVWPTT